MNNSFVEYPLHINPGIGPHTGNGPVYPGYYANVVYVTATEAEFEDFAENISTVCKVHLYVPKLTLVKELGCVGFVPVAFGHNDPTLTMVRNFEYPDSDARMLSVRMIQELARKHTYSGFTLGNIAQALMEATPGLSIEGRARSFASAMWKFRIVNPVNEFFYEFEKWVLLSLNLYPQSVPHDPKNPETPL